MAEATAMTGESAFLVWAFQGAELPKQVTPLTLEVKIVGTVLGVVVASVGVWLALAHRAQAGKPEEERGLAAGLRWRTPIALLLAICGVLVTVGVWIDPTKAPRTFVLVWLGAMGLLAVTILAAGVDLWQVRRIATSEKRALIQSDRERLFEELSRRRPPPPKNGQMH